MLTKTPRPFTIVETIAPACLQTGAPLLPIGTKLIVIKAQTLNHSAYCALLEFSNPSYASQIGIGYVKYSSLRETGKMKAEELINHFSTPVCNKARGFILSKLLKKERLGCKVSPEVARLRLPSDVREAVFCVFGLSTTIHGHHEVTLQALSHNSRLVVAPSEIAWETLEKLDVNEVLVAHQSVVATRGIVALSNMYKKIENSQLLLEKVEEYATLLQARWRKLGLRSRYEKKFAAKDEDKETKLQIIDEVFNDSDVPRLLGSLQDLIKEIKISMVALPQRITARIDSEKMETEEK